MPIYVPGKVVLRKTWQPMDPDAAAYITAVEAADTAAGQSGGLEEKTKIAIDNFVLGCKADGIWTAIKASCILAGARTLSGALVSLVGTAPTNNNFVSGDYNRKTGLVGNASTKYLDSNRANNADPQNSKHCACFISEAPSSTAGFLMSSGVFGTSGNTGLFNDGTPSFTYLGRVNVGNSDAAAAIDSKVFGSNTFVGIARNASNSQAIRALKTPAINIGASVAPNALNLIVYGQPTSTSTRSNARLAFYSIGEFLDLALLDARVTDLINAIGAAF